MPVERQIDFAENQAGAVTESQATIRGLAFEVDRNDLPKKGNQPALSNLRCFS